MTDPTKPTETPDSLAGQSLGAAHGSATVMDEYERLDKIISDCKHGLLVASRLQAKGRELPEWMTESVRVKLSEAIAERAIMDRWIGACDKSPNDKLTRSPST